MHSLRETHESDAAQSRAFLHLLHDEIFALSEAAHTAEVEYLKIRASRQANRLKRRAEDLRSQLDELSRMADNLRRRFPEHTQ